MNKYKKLIKGKFIDVYDVLDAFSCGCSASEHAVKKLLMAGLRGGKDRAQDLQEAKDSIDRAIQNHKGKNEWVANLK